MEAFEKWLKGEKWNGDYGTRISMKAAYQAGMAHYAQNDLAGDERKRIVALIREGDTGWHKQLADRIEGG